MHQILRRYHIFPRYKVRFKFQNTVSQIISWQHCRTNSNVVVRYNVGSDEPRKMQWTSSL